MQTKFVADKTSSPHPTVIINIAAVVARYVSRSAVG